MGRHECTCITLRLKTHFGLLRTERMHADMQVRLLDAAFDSNLCAYFHLLAYLH
jgi:hypothetical protein